MEQTRPSRAIVVLLDSLNRHHLGAYGGDEFETPNLDAFAKQAVRFDQHYSGALPCMPARHDLLCGAWDFLWKPWGSIEIWEQPVTARLRAAGVVTKLVSDHPHLFETGGENYHTDFHAWDYLRGHEGDPWRTRPDPSWAGAPSFGRGWMPYDDSRGYFREEADFPGPRTMTAASRWLREEAPHHEKFLLFVDEFDPHEPFDTPEPYASMYDPGWEGPHLIWPPYAVGAVARGVITAEQGRQVRAQYGGKLTMIDRWFGEMLKALDDAGLSDSTAVFLLTDHGHYLGEKDQYGKPRSPVFQTLGHIPLLVRWPGVEPGSRDALTTSVDVPATLIDMFDAPAFEHRTHGTSLVEVITGGGTGTREHLLCGIWGREVHLVRRGEKYARAPEGPNEPLSMWSNRWSTMPVNRAPGLRLPLPDDRAVLDRMPGSKVPVIRQPFREGDMQPFWAAGRFTGSHLYDLSEDPSEERNLVGSNRERDAADALREALRMVDAPDDQFARLGLA